MKKISMIIGMILVTAATNAQTGRPVSPQIPDRPVYNPNQLPNYYQNNASYNNNSIQNNKPMNPIAGPYTGNGDYGDPTKNITSPPTYNNNINQLPSTTPVYTAPAPVNTSTPVDKR